MRRVFVGLFLAILAFLIPFSIIRADELDDINNQLSQLKKDLADKEANHSDLNNQLEGIKARVAQIETDVDKGEKELSRMILVLNERMRRHYININKNAANFVYLLVSDNFARAFNNFFYQGVIVDQDKTEIIKTARYIKDLKEKKAWLAQVQIEIDKQTKALAGEITSTRQKIATLSEQQQSLIAQKQASLNIPRSAGTSARGCSDDRGVNPGFSPRLAFFTFGAPHRVGLNQYGAKGRAEAGQGRDDILRAYYANFEITKWENKNIKVQGYREVPLEEYMLGIYEMPESWPMAALEAQAIAARSFALAYTNNGEGEICTTEACQVFNQTPKTGAWADAVRNTEGLVMTNGGSPIKAWYASTHGGYVFTSAEIWGGGTAYTKHATDTSSGSAGSVGDLQNSAFDRSSPWFYCDWGSRGEYSNTAWLKPSEVADIANAILLARADSGTSDKLYQPDKPHPFGREVWSEERVKQELKNRGITPFNNAPDVSTSSDFGYGKTNGVTVSGDGKSENFGGDEFKGWFNLRAPANIQIVGPLFNVERQ